MLDYIIVGLGLAGVSFCERLEAEGKSFRIISDNSQQASIVAGGLYNPVILKRFTLAWKARSQMDMALPFYAHLEKKLDTRLDYKLPVLRRFASIEEQNTWFEAMDHQDLGYFLSPKILQNHNPCIDAPYGYGVVKYTGRIETRELLKKYHAYLIKNELLVQEKFEYAQLAIAKESVAYKQFEARQIVFAEGYGLKMNPYFQYLPMNGTKGELLTIKATDLKEAKVIKSSVFIIPLGNDLYRVGATYKWKDKTNTPTAASKNELLEKLDSFLQCDYQVVDHVAGVRPTVVDRRPLVGRHPKIQNMYVLNGFGSRGVLIAPYASQNLFDHIEHGGPLDPEMNSARFTEKYHLG